MATEQRNSPSPSPPANPPTSSAPGPRVKALRDIFDLSLRHTLDKCTYDNFAECFPTPAKHVPEALSGLHRDFIAKLDQMCRNEFACLLQERDVARSLNELDFLIADAKSRKEQTARDASSNQGTAPPTPPHLLPPEAILSAHLSPFLGEQVSNVSSRLDASKSSNLALAQEISAQRKSINELIQGLEDVVSDLEGASEAFRGDQMQELETDLQQFASST